jgi:hypothetical protein
MPADTKVWEGCFAGYYINLPRSTENFQFNEYPYNN